MENKQLTNPPYLSVIIPTRERWLEAREAIISINSQANNCEIIVVDDSKENIQTYLREFANVIVIRDESAVRLEHKNKIAFARNRGLETAQGKFIALLDSDDIWLPGFLSHVIVGLESRPDWSGAICLSQKIFAKNVTLAKRTKLYVLNGVKDFLLLLSYVFNKKTVGRNAPFLMQTSHAVFRRETFDRYRFRTDVAYGEDWYLFAEILLKEKVGIFLSRKIGFRYEENSNTFTQARQTGDDKQAAYNKLVDDFEQMGVRGIFLFLFKIYLNLFMIR